MPKYWCRIEIEEDAATPLAAAQNAVLYVQENPSQIMVLVTGPKGEKYVADTSVDAPAQKLKVSQKTLEDHFFPDELNVLLQAARDALADGEVFDSLVERELMSDSQMKRLQEKLGKFLPK